MKKLLFLLLPIFLIFSCNREKATLTPSAFRIISLTPSITRILFNLGAEDNIIGVSDFCTYKGRIKELIKSDKLQRVCGFNTLNFEKIIALNPSLVLGMDSISLESKKHLENLLGKDKIKWFIHPINMAQIEKQIIEIGKIIHKEKEAKKIVISMQKKLLAIKKSSSKIENKKRVIIEIGNAPFTTVGINTFLYNFVELAGGINALQIHSNWPTPTLEDVIAAKPDILVKLDNSDENNFIKILMQEGVKIVRPINTNDFFQPGVESINAIETLYNYLK